MNLGRTATMLPQRHGLARTAIGALLAATVVGCSRAHRPDAAASTVQTSAGATGESSESPRAPASAARLAAPASMFPATTSAVTRATYLCQGAVEPQDAADSYMGALSANQLAEASACVFPGTVDSAVTKALLTTASRTATYLLDPTSSTPPFFVYDGAGKRVTVTVTLESDGHNWVTAVQVR